MKHGTAIGCIEFNGANIYSTPPTADPNEANLNLEVKVYKLNPDGSKGELIRTEKKEEEKMYPRKDRDEIVATAKKLIAEGHTQRKAAEILNVSVSTLAAWLGKEKKQKETKKDYFGTPIIEPKLEKEQINDKSLEYMKHNYPDVFNDKPTVPDPAPEPAPVNYDQAVNQLTLGFIIEIYASDLPPVDKLGLIAKQIKVWEEL